MIESQHSFSQLVMTICADHFDVWQSRVDTGNTPADCPQKALTRADSMF